MSLSLLFLQVSRLFSISLLLHITVFIKYLLLSYWICKVGNLDFICTYNNLNRILWKSIKIRTQ